MIVTPTSCVTTYMISELKVLAPCVGIATVYDVGVAPETVTASAS